MRTAASHALHAQGPDLTVSYRYLMLFGAVVLAPYQIYFLPAAGTYFPLALFFAYGGLITLRLRSSDVSLMLAFAAYALTVLASGLWSSDRGAWAYGVVYGFLFFYAFFISRSFSRGDELARILNAFLLVSSFNAVLVVVFRLSPGIEEMYFNSSLRELFKNAKLVANFELFRPNVYDPEKSGGIFDNANTGAAFSLLCLGATISTLGTRGRFASAVYLVLFTLAIGMSGSKSAALIFGTGMSVLALVHFLRLRNVYLRMILLCIAGSIAVAGFVVSIILEDSIGETEFGQDVAQTSEYRKLLWRIAWHTFPDRPVLGLGFGGWGDALWTYAATGVNTSWPPHNSLIQIWADSGLVALLFVALFWGMVFMKLIRRARFDSDRRRALGAAFGMVCVAAMSLGDTFPLMGNLNMSVPFGVLVAWGLLERESGQPMEGATTLRSGGRT